MDSFIYLIKFFLYFSLQFTYDFLFHLAVSRGYCVSAVLEFR